MEVDIQKIMELLPHRYPFLLVDKVIDIVPGESATGIKNVTINEEFFQGHFPGKPVMPGVLILEAMAQTAGVMAMLSQTEAAGKTVYFMGIDGAKFRKVVGPGDTLQMKVKTTRGGGSVWKFDAEAYVGDTLVTQAKLTAMMGAE
ncbi:3-hydroxyacyl-[acyl-carrier-protein] dehydratase FabZ [Kordiimonas sediminis]|uniref:3-hydroxyacyl-[acyl-carrier-protein] dehydratase FabZ n=1 Tax=Kordiimonas sediminis TaxID=1735581 RepID=A0A919E9S3_9PROT|nr:3-hydroxyacyl-ACP dehydratase FabZ [Kordiimonas sediminis]GHF28465.1 3-hydroxyacyl-[acyl-carrier-protein] dehydratase FabZ [Kordiimonas sediminis]